MKDAFAQIVAAAQAAHVQDHAPAPTDADALDEITGHLDWIHINLDEDDPAIVRLENLAGAVAAAERYAALLLAQVTEEQVAKLIAEVR